MASVFFKKIVLSGQVVYGVGCAAFAALWHALAADTPAGWPSSSGSGSSGSGAEILCALSAYEYGSAEMNAQVCPGIRCAERF
eukprot:COSAG04_NODE_10722_length_757_cov_0.960486_3_plen_83_part_00